MRVFIEDEAFFVGNMKSGRLYMDLTSTVGWEGFPSYAEEFVKLLSGEILNRSDSVDVRVWEVTLRGLHLRLVYEDFPVMISLESQSEEGDDLIEALRNTIMKEIELSTRKG